MSTATHQLRRAVRRFVLTGMLLGTIVTTEAVSVAAERVAENVATRWVSRALDAVRSGNPPLHTGTPGAARTYAMTTLAMYDAVNGIDTADGMSTRGRGIVTSYAAAPRGASRDAAASAAAHVVLRALFAANAGQGASIDAAQEAEVTAFGSGPEVEAGRAWGIDVGNEVLAARANDGAQVARSESGRSGPGAFPRRFNGVQFADLTPFGIASTAVYASVGPPSLTSEAYASAFNEVRALGSSTDGDAERAAIARHWLAETGTVRETGLWFKVALEVVRDQGTLASLSETVRLFALLGMGTADSVAVSWTDKLAWYYWRPGDAIRQAAADGNPATDEDPTWNPRNGRCASADVGDCSAFGGTPEHTSGTSAFAGAAAEILASFYCTDRIPFTFTGEQPNAAPRSYNGFAEAAREAGRSRVYGGIHFQFSNDAGRESGKRIGREILQTRLRPAEPNDRCTGRLRP